MRISSITPHAVLFTLVALCFAFATSCVTPADLDNIEQAQEDYQDSVDAKLEAYEAGDISKAELEAAMRAADEKRKEELEAVKKDVEERTGSLITTDPTSLALTAGTAIVGAIMGTNRIRDRRRKRLGEKTTT